MPPTRMLCFNATKMLCSSSTRVLCSSSHQCASLTRFLVCSMRDKKLCSHSDRSCANWARASMCSVAPSMAIIVSRSTGVNGCPAPVSADWCHSGSASVPWVHTAASAHVEEAEACKPGPASNKVTRLGLPGWDGGSRRQGGSVLMIFIGCDEGSLSGRGRFCPDAGRFCADSARCMLLNGQRSGLSTSTINVAERGAE